ncbi:MAG: tetratricopeptide repeat protein, partial [Candidatus Acidiferrales bacterium]
MSTPSSAFRPARPLGWVAVLALFLTALPAAGRQEQRPVAEQEASPEAPLAAAQEALDRKDYAAAASLLEKFLFEHPGHIGALFNLAYCYSLEGRAAEAMEVYRQTLEVDPKLTAARLNLGLLLLENGKAADAVAEFDEILQSAPDHYRAHLYRGAALEHLGEKEKALEEYRKAAALDPKAAEPRRAALALLLASQDWAAAEAVVAELATLAPEDSELASLRGELLENQGKKEEALAAYENYFASRSSRPGSRAGEMRLRAGRLARELSRAEEALQHFEAAAREGGEAYAHTSVREQADTLAELKRWPEAIALYQKALQQQPGEAELRASLGYALLQTHQYETAAHELRAAVRMDPARVSTYGDLASAYYLGGFLEEALETLNRRADRAPETPGTLFLRALSHDKLQQ